MTPTDQDNEIQNAVWASLASQMTHAINCTDLEHEEQDNCEDFTKKNFEQLMQLITADRKRVAQEAYRKGYKAGHQKGSTVNSPRKAKAYKHELIVKDFIDRLPASSKTCDCTTCEVINNHIIGLKAQQEEV